MFKAFDSGISTFGQSIPAEFYQFPDFGTDGKLNYTTTRPVGKFVTAMSGLEMGMENGKFWSEIG